MEIDAPEPQSRPIKDEEFFRAAESGDSSVFQALSPEQLTRALSLTDEDGRSVLHVAVSSAKLDVRLTSEVSFFGRDLLNCVLPLSFWKYIVGLIVMLQALLRRSFSVPLFRYESSCRNRHRLSYDFSLHVEYQFGPLKDGCDASRDKSASCDLSICSWESKVSISCLMEY